MIAPLLDTHAWIWWMDGDPRLPRRISESLDALSAGSRSGDVRDDHVRPSISDVSLWEMALLVKRGRYVPSLEFDEWLDISLRAVQVRSITPDVAVALERLPATFQKDPADQLIVATCRACELPLVTMDDRIRKSRLVKLWRG